jgi:N-acetylglucosaminyl-diphospho-decaprenol L-rhamnosyltransferase
LAFWLAPLAYALTSTTLLCFSKHGFADETVVRAISLEILGGFKAIRYDCGDSDAKLFKRGAFGAYVAWPASWNVYEVRAMSGTTHASKVKLVGLVLHFRTPERTLACLESMHRERLVDVVVVDNSQDQGASLNAMTATIRTLMERGLNVTLLPQERNMGFAGGVKAGIRFILEQQASDILLINSDATLNPGALDKMKELLPGAALVAPYACSTETGKRKSPIVFYHKYLALYLRWPLIGSVRYPSGSCLLIRSDYLHADIFNDEFFFYGEDVLLGHQIAHESVAFVDCPDATVIHKGSASSKNGSPFYEYHMNRAHWLLAQKLASNAIDAFACLLMRCLTLPARALVRSARWRSLTPITQLVRATLDVLRGRCSDLTPPAGH